MNVSKKARQYFGSQEGQKNISICAIVTANPFMTLFVNFFIKIEMLSPIAPCKVFNNEKLALKWLRTNLEKMDSEFKLHSL